MKKLTALIAALAIGGFAVSAQAVPGGSCGESVTLPPGAVGMTVDTTTTTNWIGLYGGSGSSPSNDFMTTFTTGATAPTGSITPTAASYPFAMYLLSACTPGTDASLLAATGTVGSGINLGAVPVFANTTYWVAFTGAPLAPATANGTVTFDTPDPLPVTLQSFEIN